MVQSRLTYNFNATMPMLNGYQCCVCASSFEFLRMTDAEALACPNCGSTDNELQLGGRTFPRIVPMYPGAKRRKAGYVHQYVNRPAEGFSVSVPHGQGASS